MTTREKALLFSPGILGLVIGLGWFVLDPKGDARQHLIDRSVRAAGWLGNRLRDTARL